MIVSYWTGSVLQECMGSVLAQPEVEELVVVNNGNPSSVVGWLRERAADDGRIRLLEPGKNTGFAAGCNLGAAQARCDFIALVNPDCVLPAGTIGSFLSIFENHADAWLCGGRLKNPDGTEQRGGRREILSPWRAFVELMRFDRLFPHHPYFRRLHLDEEDSLEEVREVPTVSGACMVIPKRIYERVGGMDDNMFLHFDDADLCIRILQHGGKVLYCGNVPVIHHLSSSDVSRTFIEWHKTRSTSYYFHKHFQVSYPTWSLTLVSAMLWLRLLVLAPKFLAGDLPGMVRRLRRR